MNVGDLVIINDFDRPCAELIAVVTKVDGEKLSCRYLSANVDGYEGKDVGTTADRAALVSDFGVLVELEEYQFRTEKVEYSCVKYDDGRVRLWQGEENDVEPLAKEWWYDEYQPILRRSEQ